MSALGEIHLPQTTLAAWNESRSGAFEALQNVGRAIRTSR
jgi:D-ribulokinase